MNCPDLCELGEVVFAAEGTLPQVLLALPPGGRLVQLLLLRPDVVKPTDKTLNNISPKYCGAGTE